MLARIEGLLKLGLEIIRSLWAGSPGVPKGTLVGLPEQRGSLFWTVAGRRGKPAMMVVGNFQFTNVHAGETSVEKSVLVVRHRLRRSKYEGYTTVQGRNTTLHSRFAVIPSNGTTSGKVLWFIQPPITPSGKPLGARAIFIDRFGNKHWTDPLTFEAR
jgi:hypothetical protein